MMDYRADNKNTVGEGSTIRVITEIGADNELKETMRSTKHSNKVTVRWIFKKELEKLAKNAITVCDISEPKFDALIEYNSNAADYIKDEARKIANIYRQNSVIVQNSLDTTEIGEVFISGEGEKFKNSVHPKYSDFNDFELQFARELDKTNLTWMRNPKSGFLKIKLLDGMGTDTFNPDFLVWADHRILALDTKGDHLIYSDSDRKLFDIEKIGNGDDLIIKLVSQKRYNKNKQVIDEKGYTVWMKKQGELNPFICSTLEEAVSICIQ
jgi:type III restriction enzyme